MSQKPWHDAELMRELYEDRKMSSSEISEYFDGAVGARHVSHLLNELGVPKRSASERRILATLKSRKPCFYTSNFGYERWETNHRGERFVVQVHRMLAVAEYGFAAVTGDNHVHHKNGIPWDNRPENIQVLSSSDHMAHHAKERDDWGNEVGLIAQHGAEAVLGPDEVYGSKKAARRARGEGE